MSTTTHSRRRPLVLWGIVIAAILVLVWFLLQLAGPDEALVISRETTFITEPLAEDGWPDYLAYYDKRAREGVTPENNAAPLLWQAMWPGELTPDQELPMANALGFNTLPSANAALQAPYNATVRDAVAAWLEMSQPDAEGDSVDEPSEPPFDEGGYGYGGYQSDWRISLPEEVVDQAMSRPWASQQIPPLADWVAANETPLALILQASERPRYYSPSPSVVDGSDDMLIALLLPDIQMLRGVARALKVRAMWHLGEGRPMEAWNDLFACHRVTRFARQNDTIVGQLVGIAIDGIACEGTATLLHHGDLSEEQTAQILRELESLDDWDQMATAIDHGERLMYLDAITFFASGRSEDGFAGWVGGGQALDALAYTRINWNDLLREGNIWYDRLTEIARQPMRAEREKAFGEFDDDLQQLSQSVNRPTAWVGGVFSAQRRTELLSATMISLFLPAMSAAMTAEDRGNCKLAMLRTSAALAVYRARTGEYPESLEALVPEILATVPVDLFSAKPLLYERRGEGYLLYSTGDNGEDDGATNHGEIAKGEWVSHEQSEWERANSYGGESGAEGDDLVFREPIPPLKIPVPPPKKPGESADEPPL